MFRATVVIASFISSRHYLCATQQGPANVSPGSAQVVVHVADSTRHPVQNGKATLTRKPSYRELASATTNSRGVAVLKGDSGTYDLIIHAIGFAPERRPVTLRTAQTDTVTITLHIDPWLVAQRNESRLLSDRRQPRLVLQQLTIQPTRLCDGVDSVIVAPPTVSVLGYRSSPVTPAGVFGNIYRRGIALILDIFNDDPKEFGNSIECIRWRATIDRLPLGRMSLTVRHMGDPSVSGQTRHLLSHWLDTRIPEVFVVGAKPP